MAGWLPNPKVEVAAMGAGINTSGTFFMLFSGLSQASAGAKWLRAFGIAPASVRVPAPPLTRPPCPPSRRH